MRRSRYTTLLWTALAAGLIGWMLGLIVVELSGSVPAALWVLIPVLLVMAALAFVGTRLVRGWVDERRYDEFVDALGVARLFVLAKALTMFGVAVAGGSIGLGLLAADRLTGTAGRDRLLVAVGVALCGLFVTIAALRLERACEVPHPPRDENEEE